MKKGVLVGGIFALVLAGAALVMVFTQPIVVQGAAVTRGDITKTEQLSGTYIPMQKQNVRSTKNGIVYDVAIEAGDALMVGDTVITLSGEGISAELAAVQTALRKLETGPPNAAPAGKEEADDAIQEALSLALANAESARTKAQGPGIEYVELNAAVANFIAANASAVFASAGQTEPEKQPEHKVDEAEKQKLLDAKEELNAQLAGLDVFSAVAGSVLFVEAAPGTKVQSGDVIAVVGNAKGGLITAIDAAGRIEMDDEVTLTCNGLSWLGWVVERDGNTLYIQPETGFVANGDIAVTATLEAALDVCILPVECFGEDNSGEYVLILNGDGRLERRNVTTALEQGGRVAVTSGIGIGETAVLYPDRYKEGIRAELFG